ncbi:hypothetical protein LWI29_003749 [Acer saccharum]|uniref:Uncharacterized protein n=1 Tax=Acer saccharum TaxID=4024 RepID=A0AA39RUL1_ACESA|nr:hypothetical protein LWI29_003749 [Acer saccharum]
MEILLLIWLETFVLLIRVFRALPWSLFLLIGVLEGTFVLPEETCVLHNGDFRAPGGGLCAPGGGLHAPYRRLSCSISEAFVLPEEAFVLHIKDFHALGGGLRAPYRRLSCSISEAIVFSEEACMLPNGGFRVSHWLCFSAPCRRLYECSVSEAVRVLHIGGCTCSPYRRLRLPCSRRRLPRSHRRLSAPVGDFLAPVGDFLLQQETSLLS